MATDVKDAGRLNDISQAAAVASFVQGRTETEYGKDLMFRSAVERQVEIIGEAARAISPSFKIAHAEIPWHKISATRNILAHDYGMVKHDIMRRIATVHIPELLLLIAPLVPPPPSTP